MQKRKQHAGGQAGADIEITPEMIGAGVNELWDSGRLCYEAGGSDRLLIKEIWETMERARLAALQNA